ncbi:D-glycero-beta-D-manno-heptose 1-phosphate adenylyltransferase [Sagittula sp. MA-2]|jgi:D-beta-D-heptose 7-phosphate kinase/D-beta-D-heptose 1-phosphate adenosyltransferase|uniref:D-glycero-beta-D-manno-heptose 1-phosphate adenylyltransferase n=1 Tax=Sagittula sp. MA-2 TaxID=3048007 RepID=UPI0024C2E1E4|nr:D-glycero-beta-D-manno-heptose 1-phosphate adenylyltransferase [Sagittula sp. MA-2]WHZ37722.1 D-glycero-beta-D-manno-heptose 1-phosphate adenylyltransferase [Sagittula sp. MA-2]
MIAIPENFSEVKIVCVGDVMLDAFHSGDVTRISPEAPVPVLKLTDTIVMPGGAANMACNIASLGATVTLVAPVGDDDAGSDLRRLCEEEWGVHLITAVDARGTILKSRYSSGSQQLLRIDREDLSPLKAETRRELTELALSAISNADLVVLSDYAKGALDTDICQRIIGAACARDIPVIVDPKGRNFQKYKGATVVTPNEFEISVAVGRAPESDSDLIGLASGLAVENVFQSVAVTRGKNGVMLVDPDGLVEHVPSFAKDVFDVSGAGDSFVAGLACALCSGQELINAVHFANTVAGVAVSKVGTAVVSIEEVRSLALLRSSENKARITSDYNEAAKIISSWRKMGDLVGFTNGVFDLLHLGHLKTLKNAKQHCKRLVVAINSDSSVKRLKGEGRPVQEDVVRAEVLANLEQVDLVVVFSEDTPISVIEACQPDLLLKGGDYRVEDVVGAEVVEKRGGRVMIVPTLHGYSTTATIARMQTSDG